MLNISKNSGTNVGIELTSIAVTGGSSGRGECWKFNLSNQFPIIPVNIENGEVVLDVDSPHKGFSIQTVMENGKMNGESRILNEKNVKIASLTFVDGIANGPCKLYDNKGTIFFEGYFVNGYREGKGKEYDENGNVIYEGFYKQGKRMNIVELKEMKGYWKEMNDSNEVISICQKDDECRNDGICYFYVNGKIDKVSKWKNGEELNVLKRFEGKKISEFVNGVKRYEGKYRDSIKYNYPREGEGEEYDTDGKSLVYEGQFWNNKRQGQGKLYRNGDVVYDGIWLIGFELNHILFISMIVMIISTIISFVCLWWWMGMIPLGLDIISSIVFWIYYYRNFYRNKKKNNIGKSFPMKSDNKDYNKLIIIMVCIFVVLMFNIIFVLSIFIARQSIITKCLGSYSQTSLVINSGSCNYDFITSFKPKSRLESIEIGDYCFENVNKFVVNGLNELKSLVIGEYSFISSSFEIKGIIDVVITIE